MGMKILFQHYAYYMPLLKRKLHVMLEIFGRFVWHQLTKPFLQLPRCKRRVYGIVAYQTIA